MGGFAQVINLYHPPLFKRPEKGGEERTLIKKNERLQKNEKIPTTGFPLAGGGEGERCAVSEGGGIKAKVLVNHSHPQMLKKKSSEWGKGGWFLQKGDLGQEKESSIYFENHGKNPSPQH